VDAVEDLVGDVLGHVHSSVFIVTVAPERRTMSSQATRPGIVVLRTRAAMLDYELAVADYCYGRDLAALYRALFALGISRGDCLWHAAHPGQSLVYTCTNRTSAGRHDTRPARAAPVREQYGPPPPE
jgi:hypothetical protein